MLSNRKGFTLIELLIVVVIIGILAAIAIPKFAATKDKAKLASVKTDLRNLMTAQEAYFSDFQTYSPNATATGFAFSPSAGNAPATLGSASGFTASVSNASITGTLRSCSVGVGGNAASTTVDGQIICP
jgi:prepilin-type N-terminal cleavage/methylation domain-containing protein